MRLRRRPTEDACNWVDARPFRSSNQAEGQRVGRQIHIRRGGGKGQLRHFICRLVADQVEYRGVVDRLHRDRHCGHVRVDCPIVGHISEAIQPMIVEIGCIGERAIGVEGQQPASRIAHRDRHQVVPIRIAVITQHPRRRDNQRRILTRQIAVFNRNRRLVGKRSMCDSN